MIGWLFDCCGDYYNWVRRHPLVALGSAGTPLAALLAWEAPHPWNLLAMFGLVTVWTLVAITQAV